MAIELDKFDRGILAILQADARRSAESIGAQVGLRRRPCSDGWLGCARRR